MKLYYKNLETKKMQITKEKLQSVYNALNIAMISTRLFITIDSLEYLAMIAKDENEFITKISNELNLKLRELYSIKEAINTELKQEIQDEILKILDP